MLLKPFKVHSPDGESFYRDESNPATEYTANVAQGAEAVTLDDLSTLVVRLVRALRKASPDSDLPEKALGYLYRKNLAPAVLRGGAFGEYAAPPAQTALTDDARDAARYRWLRDRTDTRDQKPFIAIMSAGGISMWNDTSADDAIDAALTAAQSGDKS